MDWRDEAWQHIDKIAAQVADDVTRDWLRPALSAAGFAPQDVERFEVTYESAPYCGGFNPGMFAQESDGNANCAGAHWNCQPWPEADGS